MGSSESEGATDGEIVGAFGAGGPGFPPPSWVGSCDGSLEACVGKLDTVGGVLGAIEVDGNHDG